ncbi:MAG TPA: aminoglycoside 6-adenylyltransferase [Anaerolineaceae bacterium]|nr:aminoglycoside 6-adenylyltransferase [Anaerolineaceae bacterium]HQJ32894.1 aminoglycoside 6-adenylyltransferase [Anaerolineaceae bacterium]
MRTEQEMFDLILDFAWQDERVRVVAMNGSRANPNVPRDAFQDYDIVFVVTEMDSFLASDAWLSYFGRRIIMQKPEGMELFPSEGTNRFSYLMLFEDGNRIDLTLLPLEELGPYLKEDSLLQVLLDKDGRVPALPESSDMDYWVKRPTPGMFDDCCNEFWWLSTYVAKGLARGELPYAIAHLDLMRKQLMTMLSWQVGLEKGFTFSMGKQFKYLQQHVKTDVWQRLCDTWNDGSPEACAKALGGLLVLFRETSKDVAVSFGYSYPDYDEKVNRYLGELGIAAY